MMPRNRKAKDPAATALIGELNRVTEGLAQDEVAAMDEAIDQRDVSRWRRGDYTRTPGETKTAGIRRVIALRKEILAGRHPYAHVLVAAADEIEQVAERLRTTAIGSSAGRGDPTKAAKHRFPRGAGAKARQRDRKRGDDG